MGRTKTKEGESDQAWIRQDFSKNPHMLQSRVVVVRPEYLSSAVKRLSSKSFVVVLVVQNQNETLSNRNRLTAGNGMHQDYRFVFDLKLSAASVMSGRVSPLL